MTLPHAFGETPHFIAPDVRYQRSNLAPSLDTCSLDARFDANKQTHAADLPKSEARVRGRCPMPRSFVHPCIPYKAATPCMIMDS